MALGSSGDSQSTFQNISQGIFALQQTYINVNGAQNLADITTPTLVSAKGGRLCKVSIIVAGSGNGAIYDNTDITSTLRQIWVIPQTLGLMNVNWPVGYGITVVPGTGQTVAVSWS